MAGVRSFVERDLPQLGVTIPAASLERFWAMLAHYHAQVWSASEFARSFGVSDVTVRRYLDLLTGVFMVRQLPPWFENLGKRQIRTPKVYLRDSGLLHALLSVPSFAALESHPKLGASWEGFALEEVLRVTGDRDAYFWHTQGGAALDLLVFLNGERFGFEFKYADVPTVTRSLQVARHDLRFRQALVVHPGPRSYSLNEWADAVSIQDLRRRVKQLADAEK